MDEFRSGILGDDRERMGSGGDGGWRMGVSQLGR